MPNGCLGFGSRMICRNISDLAIARRETKKPRTVPGLFVFREVVLLDFAFPRHQPAFQGAHADIDQKPDDPDQDDADDHDVRQLEL